MGTRTRTTDIKTLVYAVAGPERPVPVYNFLGQIFYERPGRAYRNAPPLPFEACNVISNTLGQSITAIPELKADAEFTTNSGREGVFIHVERLMENRYLVVFYMDDMETIRYPADLPLSLNELPTETTGPTLPFSSGSWQAHESDLIDSTPFASLGGIGVDSQGNVYMVSDGTINIWDSTGWLTVVANVPSGYGLTYNLANNQLYYIFADVSNPNDGAIYRRVRDTDPTPEGFTGGDTSFGPSLGGQKIEPSPPEVRNMRALAVGDADSDYDLYLLDVGAPPDNIYDNIIYGTELDSTGAIPSASSWTVVKHISDGYRYQGMAVKGNDFYLSIAAPIIDASDQQSIPVRIYRAGVDGVWEFGGDHVAAGLAFHGNNLLSLSTVGPGQIAVRVFEDVPRLVGTTRQVPKSLFVDADGEDVDISFNRCNSGELNPSQVTDWIAAVKRYARAKQAIS